MMSFLKPSAVIHGLAVVVINIIVFVVLVIAIEGALGWYRFFTDVQKIGLVAEALHTDYDPDLSWVNKANFFKQDMYGSGNDLTTLENRTRLTSHENEKKDTTAICTGDSFTLGYGVDDVETWCALLGNNHRRMINMGQGGYGIDQNVLWYERDAKNIPHQLHFIAFNTLDFDRTFSDTFLGFDKPYFVLDGETIKNTQNPVPRPAEWKRFLAKNLPAFEKLNIFRVLTTATERPQQFENTAEQQKIIAGLLQKFSQLTAERGAKLVYVLLPTVTDKLDRAKYSQIKSLILQLSEKYHFEVIDVGEKMFEAESEEYEQYFIPAGTMAFSGAAGHYTESGNAQVAKIIREAMAATPSALPTP